jgi:hypothetical protein
MDISSLIPMVGDGPDRFLIELISRINPQILSIQQGEFHTGFGGDGNSEIVCFYEIVESPTTQEVYSSTTHLHTHANAEQDKYGNWAMTGPTALLVTKSSATHCRWWEDGAYMCRHPHALRHGQIWVSGPHVGQCSWEDRSGRGSTRRWSRPD